MNKNVDDVEQNVGKLSDDSQEIHEKLPVFRFGLVARPSQLVVDEISEYRVEYFLAV